MDNFTSVERDERDRRQLEQELKDRLGDDDYSKKTHLMLSKMSESYKESKENRGMQSSMQDKIEHLKRVRETLKNIKEEGEMLAKQYNVPTETEALQHYLSHQNSRKRNQRACKCARYRERSHDFMSND